jgi:hypothetical protein
MEFVRQIMPSSALESVLPLPSSFSGLNLEVIVLPAGSGNGKSGKKTAKKSAFGRLKAFANPALIPNEKGAWESAVAEKYGN